MYRSIHRNVCLVAASIGLVAACSASKTGTGTFTSGPGGGGSGSTQQTTSGTNSTSSGDQGGVGGSFVGSSGNGGSTASGTVCNNPPNIDGDGDGWTGAEGDCNDCDPNVNPGAIDVADNDAGMVDTDCSGAFDPPQPCDDNLALDDPDPRNGARAVDLCKFTVANPADKKQKTWGVLDAQYVRADGTPYTPGPQVGIQDGWGPNVHPQGGKKLFALSSGHARLPGQPASCDTYLCADEGAGTAPPGFPQDTSGCPGSSAINDDVALQVKIRTPTNATGFSFAFNFYTFEYPEWVCTDFNDQFISLVSPAPMGSINGNISFDSMHNPVSVNIAFFDVCTGCALGANQLIGTGFDGTWDDGGATGWLKSQAPVKGGDEITIRWAIWDTGDQVWDSTALIDNFQWIANGGTVTIGTDPIGTPK
jgi:hypothetical protein